MNPIDRRRFLALGGAAVAMAMTERSAPSCEGSTPDNERPLPVGGDGSIAPAGRPDLELRLVAEVSDIDLGPLGSFPVWVYNGGFPGREIRVREGEQLRVLLENRLPEPTTVHWHGVPVPNAMDGVPAVTQKPIAPGETFVYEFEAGPAGTYMYHSHVALQLDRGLFGPLVIEERTPHVQYDREYSITLDDLLLGEPRLAEGGHMSMMMGMGAAGPEYDAFLVNGRPSADPAIFEVRRGERLRLRLINPSSQSTYRVAIAGHTMNVTHADGRPVRPVEVDALVIGMGERYDVMVEAGNPGAWNLVASSVERQRGTARAVLRYLDAARSRPPQVQTPAGITGGRVLTLDDLESTDAGTPPGGAPDRTFELRLSSRMMSDGWMIDRQAYPEAEPLEIHEGERVRVRLSNMSMLMHPMHLHGHFFRTGGALKETVIVPAHMGRITFDFTADNPGDWLFHCHNLYHMEAGMARVFRYV